MTFRNHPMTLSYHEDKNRHLLARHLLAHPLLALSLSLYIYIHTRTHMHTYRYNRVTSEIDQDRREERRLHCESTL